MKTKTANFRVIPDGNESLYQFFCALSDAHACTTRTILAATPELALELARATDGKQHFNHCSTILAPGAKYCSHCGRLIGTHSKNFKGTT